jgi:hypothetical protein
MSGYLFHCVLQGEHFFYQDMFTLCGGHYGVYACIPGRAILSASDEMDLSTRVYAIRCACAAAATSYLVR